MVVSDSISRSRSSFLLFQEVGFQGAQYIVATGWIFWTAIFLPSTFCGLRLGLGF